MAFGWVDAAILNGLCPNHLPDFSDRVCPLCGALPHAPFFPQLAAMHAIGPYRIPNVSVDASLAYTNTTPSGSVRAPTAPQACWAAEQHMDSVAAAIGRLSMKCRCTSKIPGPSASKPTRIV